MGNHKSFAGGGLVKLGPTLAIPWTVVCEFPLSSVHGISQARLLDWVAISFSGDILDPEIKRGSLALQANSLPTEPPENLKAIQRSLVLILSVNEESYKSFMKVLCKKHCDYREDGINSS